MRLLIPVSRPFRVPVVCSPVSGVSDKELEEFPPEHGELADAQSADSPF